MGAPLCIFDCLESHECQEVARMSVSWLEVENSQRNTGR